MSKTPHVNKAKLVKQALVSQWICPLAFKSRYEEILDTLCEDIESTYSRRVRNHLYYSDHDGLLSLSLDPNHYRDVGCYIRDNLISCWVKKYPLWGLTTDPKIEAMKTFISCEHECARTNARLLASRRVFRRDEVPSIFLIAARKIASILGDVPDIPSLPLEFGKGASFSVKRNTTAYDHITGALDVTPCAVEAAVSLLSSTPGWLSLHGIDPCDTSRIRECLTVIPGSRLSFVPKNAKTDRPINIEPGLNKVLQKGFGSVIRRRLKRIGLNLNRLPERHVRLACKGSIDGSIATVDLSNASDTISVEIVKELMPPLWYDALETLRCSQYQIEDKWYNFHKFSAMGNGYTFELESLIFYSLAYATCEYLGLSTESVSAYGDDIIIPNDAYGLLNKILLHCGFSINTTKSYNTGSFRESCGGDFYDGVSCRGFYVKDSLDLRTIVRFRNYLHRSGFRFYVPKTWRLLRRLTKVFEPLITGPDDGTDDHIITDIFGLGRRYNCVNVTVKERRLPRRWHCRRVWMLYNIYHNGRSRDPNPWDDQSMEGKLPDRKRYVVALSSRYNH